MDTYYYLELKKMPIIVATIKHSPENCAMFNAEARKATLAMLAQREALQKKYNTKMLGAWVVSNEHLVIWVMEIPTLGYHGTISE